MTPIDARMRTTLFCPRSGGFEASVDFTHGRQGPHFFLSPIPGEFPMQIVYAVFALVVGINACIIWQMWAAFVSTIALNDLAEALDERYTDPSQPRKSLCEPVDVTPRANA